MKPSLAAVQARLGLAPTAEAPERHVHDWRLRSRIVRGLARSHGMTAPRVYYRCETCGDRKVEKVDPMFAPEGKGRAGE